MYLLKERKHIPKCPNDIENFNYNEDRFKEWIPECYFYIEISKLYPKAYKSTEY